MPKCKGCGAEVQWFEMHPSGKSMIVDAKPKMMILRIGDLPCDILPDLPKKVLGRAIRIAAFVPHWASCPKADEFKRK